MNFYNSSTALVLIPVSAFFGLFSIIIDWIHGKQHLPFLHQYFYPIFAFDFIEINWKLNKIMKKLGEICWLSVISYQYPQARLWTFTIPQQHWYLSQFLHFFKLFFIIIDWIHGKQHLPFLHQYFYPIFAFDFIEINWKLNKIMKKLGEICWLSVISYQYPQARLWTFTIPQQHWYLSQFLHFFKLFSIIIDWIHGKQSLLFLLCGWSGP